MHMRLISMELEFWRQYVFRYHWGNTRFRRFQLISRKLCTKCCRSCCLNALLPFTKRRTLFVWNTTQHHHHHHRCRCRRRRQKTNLAKKQTRTNTRKKRMNATNWISVRWNCLEFGCLFRWLVLHIWNGILKFSKVPLVIAVERCCNHLVSCRYSVPCLSISWLLSVIRLETWFSARETTVIKFVARASVFSQCNTLVSVMVTSLLNMNGTISPVVRQTLHLLRSQTVLANNHFGKTINFNVLQVCKLQKCKFFGWFPTVKLLLLFFFQYCTLDVLWMLRMQRVEKPSPKIIFFICLFILVFVCYFWLAASQYHSLQLLSVFSFRLDLSSWPLPVPIDVIMLLVVVSTHFLCVCVFILSLYLFIGFFFFGFSRMFAYLIFGHIF